MRQYAIILCIFMLIFSGNTYAHPGGQDMHGCHTERATGRYHCHGGGEGDGDIEDLLLALGVAIVVVIMARSLSQKNMERLNNFEPFVNMQNDDASFGFNYTLLKF